MTRIWFRYRRPSVPPSTARIVICTVPLSSGSYHVCKSHDFHPLPSGLPSRRISAGAALRCSRCESSPPKKWRNPSQAAYRRPYHQPRDQRDRPYRHFLYPSRKYLTWKQLLHFYSNAEPHAKRRADYSLCCAQSLSIHARLPPNTSNITCAFCPTHNNQLPAVDCSNFISFVQSPYYFTLETSRAPRLETWWIFTS